MSPEEQPGGLSQYSAAYAVEHGEFVAHAGKMEAVERLAPHLTAGIRVLEIGCGRGELTVFLAKMAPDCHIYGIDLNPEQIQAAEAHAQEHGAANVRFSVGDALGLPFEDGSFDIVYCNDVLAWIPDTAGTLAEMKRVLRPSGIVAVREMIIEASFAYPLESLERRAWDVFVDLLEAEDGHPHMGKELKDHLHRAGFTDIRMSGSIEAYSDPKEMEILYAITTNWFLSFHIAETAKLYGAATDDIFEGIAKAAEEWLRHPGAFVGISFGEAMARRPN